MTPKHASVDRILTAVVTLAAFAILFIGSTATVAPSAADELASIAGLLPRATMLPGLGGLIACLFVKVLPLDVALIVNGILAKVLVALCVGLSFSIFRGMMTLVSGVGSRDWPRRRLGIRLVSFLAALAFACAEPVAEAATTVTGSTFVLFLICLTLALYVRMLETASPACSVATLFSAGLLCAETPLGWLILIFGVAMTFRVLAVGKTPAWEDFLDPTRMQRTKWTMTFAFLCAFLLGAAGEMTAFAWTGGLEAAGETSGDLPAIYASAYLDSLVLSMDISGGSLFAICALVPCILAFMMIVPATDEDQYLSFKYAIVYVASGIVAILQLAPFPTAWFWSLTEDAFLSPNLVVFGSFLSAVSFAWVLFVLAVEVFCRDYEHIENVLYQGFQEEQDDEDSPHRAGVSDETDESETEDVQSVRLSAGRLVMLAVPIVLVGGLLWGSLRTADRQLAVLLHDFVAETVEEMKGIRFLFTDGSLDSLLRLEAACRGRVCAPISGSDAPYDAFVRQCDCLDPEDRETLKTGAAEALRAWTVSNTNRLADVAAQQFVEFFRLNRRLTPVVYGLLVRPVGGDPDTAEASFGRVCALMDRLLALQADGTWRSARNKSLKDCLLSIQGRLSALLRTRAASLDAAKRREDSLAAITLANRLDASNPDLARVRHQQDWLRQPRRDDLTPREGLDIALGRADFAMARRYAMPILKSNPDEPTALFAVGMSYYVEDELTKAEEYLTRARKKLPDEAAIPNNLALICLKTDRLEEATRHVNEALRLAPEMWEIEDTRDQIKRAQEEKGR